MIDATNWCDQNCVAGFLAGQACSLRSLFLSDSRSLSFCAVASLCRFPYVYVAALGTFDGRCVVSSVSKFVLLFFIATDPHGRPMADRDAASAAQG